MANIRKHILNKVKYYIDVSADCHAYCENPSKKVILNNHPTICIVNGLPLNDDKGAKSGLRNILHECLHAENWSATEDTVTRTASEISNLLWRLGYRRVK